MGFIVPDGVAGEDFWLIAGAAAEGIPMTSFMEAQKLLAAADVVAAFRSQGIDQPINTELFTYAAVQSWAQAVAHAGSTDAARVAAMLREQRFDTVLGVIGFDDKGDVTGFDPFEWFVWTDGKWVPKDLTE